MLTPQNYQRRRAQLMQSMQARGGGMAMIASAPEVLRNADTHYPYRYDSSFYYLTGFPEPQALLVLIATPVATRSILFCRNKNQEREIWEGRRYGPEQAASTFGFDAAYAIDTIDTQLPQLMSNQPALFYKFAVDSQFDTQVRQWLASVQNKVRAGVSAATAIYDLRQLIDEMRLIKDHQEIQTMRRAAQISCSAHRRAMMSVAPGQYEYQVEAELLHEFKRQGSAYPAYPAIVAGGANACVLHYVENNQVLRDGELLLIDAGCEYDGYASDITRTFPINGRFSDAQRALYELVLAAQQAAIEVIRPGQLWNVPDQAAQRVLAQGMIDLGLLRGTLSEVLESGAHKQFYMHHTGHWLGMDVHDVGEYREPGEANIDGVRPWRRLQMGMTFTVEPGIYVRPAPEIPEKFCNIGIRIEDDVLVTDNGYEILTAAAPKNLNEIETLMQK